MDLAYEKPADDGVHPPALDCTLVTNNDTEFLRVPGLRVQNWLKIQNVEPSAGQADQNIAAS